ncbi:hypothetical protein [Listeria valentina]|uniref:hypothetical protein n=1 Tax=Listeria valentina TaxID=2705293 RepID=UPI00142FF97F|nr:hypothetical protein [Listeria valentina]
MRAFKWLAVFIIVGGILTILGVGFYSYSMLEKKEATIHELNKAKKQKEKERITLKKENQRLKEVRREDWSTYKKKEAVYQNAQAVKDQRELNRQVVDLFFNYDKQNQRMGHLKPYLTKNLFQTMQGAKSDSHFTETESRLIQSSMYWTETEDGFSTVNVVEVEITAEGHTDQVSMLGQFNYVKQGNHFLLNQTKFVEY